MGTHNSSTRTIAFDLESDFIFLRSEKDCLNKQSEFHHT